MRPARPVAAVPVVASLIGEGLSIEGKLVCTGEVQIDGALKGELKAARVAVGATGEVDGLLEADAVEIFGRVQGRVSASEVRLANGCVVEADIANGLLTVEPGAKFLGLSSRLEPA